MKSFRGSILLFTLCFLATSAYAGGLGKKLGELFGGGAPPGDEILRPELAFQFFPEAYADGNLIISWQIEPGYYLYRNKLSFSSASEQVVLGNYLLPAGQLKDDPAFGKVEVYLSDNHAVVPVSIKDGLASTFNIMIDFQGCKEKSVCYPPMKQTYTVARQAWAAPAGLTENSGSAMLSEQDSITAALKNKGMILNILSFFGFGFLLALTPCIFPMIPILSGIIVGHGKRITRYQAISLSVSYVLAMASTYAALGVIAGLFSVNIQAVSQNPWVIGLFSLVFVLLALSMFGFYRLDLPASWQARLMSKHHQKDDGTYKGAVVMGILSAIICSPCVAPPLAGALLYISHTGNALFGGLTLFAMGLGFGVPLLIVGATSGELLPRAGAWMESIRHGFGVIMLGVAIWLLERIIPANVALLLWAILFVATAIFMGALDKIDEHTRALRRLGKAFGLVILVYGMVLVIATAYGNGSVLRPFKSLNFYGITAGQTLPFETISGIDELNLALDQAKAGQQLAMLDFYADWCTVCIELEEYTFTDPAVHAALKSVKLLQTDVSWHTDADQHLMKSLELFGPPAILFFDTNSKEIRTHRLVGFIKPEDFVQHIEQIKHL